ncbi:putative protein TPRXL [Schistocerca americana]|uniref:putative protein TPRXL n=1 Tax=Schistocerca americana TaxID=7009 RepID=UPI001F4F1BB7|nr:putative protein TPRXL [Schistocerca americana]
MSHLIIVFTLFLVWACAAAGTLGEPVTSPLAVAAVPTLRQPRADYTECDGVAAGQVACADDCRTVLLCMGGSIAPTVLETCDPPSVCSAEERRCSTNTTTCSPPETSVACNAVGVFPDPNDCTVYHMCIKTGANSTRVECDGGWAYDPLTATCRLKPTDSVCTDLPLTCTELRESNVVPANPSIYYVCVQDKNGKLVPNLYKCEHGENYDPATFSCIDSTKTCGCVDSTTTSPSATESPSSTAPPSSADPTSSATPEPSSDSTSPSSATPAPSSDPTSPSSATPAPSSDPTSPSSATPQPSTDPTLPSSATPTPSNTPSTTTPPSDGSRCSTPLEKVPDPEKCNSYYECSVMFVWTYVQCNTGFYFNREDLECKYGNCPYSYSFWMQ